MKANSELIAFCLMPNHYHLVVYLGDCLDFSNVMRGFTTSYVKSFNSWHHRVGYLFQGNTQMRLIEGDEDLIHLCRYVYINPVIAIAPIRSYLFSKSITAAAVALMPVRIVGSGSGAN
jgi:REP element-mobilizing transposase RayT